MVEWAMISALLKALGQLPDPRLRKVLTIGILGAALVYVLLVGLVWWLLSSTALFLQNWAEWAADIAGGLAALILPLLIFPALATTVMGPWLERVAEAVEERHYPHLNWPRPQRWTEVVGGTLSFLAATIVVNLLALPLYAILLVTGFSIILAYAINGYLLGREYFELVAFRHLPPPEARLLFRNRLGRVWLAGAVITFLFTVPLVNLAAPVIATAFMTHLFQTLRSNSPQV